MKTTKTFIISTFNRFIDMLDARANVNLFVLKEDGSNDVIASGKVYEILADESLRKYSESVVVGISMSLNLMNILIEEVIR